MFIRTVIPLVSAIGIAMGGYSYLNGAFTNTESAIHQIYQNQLTVGGLQTILLSFGLFTLSVKAKND